MERPLSSVGIEHNTFNVGVAGSSPAGVTRKQSPPSHLRDLEKYNAEFTWEE